VGDIEIGGVFACFRCGWLALRANPTSEFLGQVIFLESGLTSEALELLVGFITYLEPALWLENTKLVKFMLSQTLTLGVFDPWP